MITSVSGVVRTLGSVILVSTIGSSAVAQPPAASYDQAGIVPAADVLKPTELQGASWRVMDQAACDGYLYTFELWTPAGWFTPESRSMLRIRQTESDALTTLTKMQNEPLFVQGFTGSVKTTAKAAGTAVKHPIETLKKVPMGLGRFAGGMVARVQEGYTPGERGDLIHMPAKRGLAFKLGVDPYTDNMDLQQALNTVSANKNYGSLTFGIGTSFIGGWVGTGFTIAKWNATALTKLRDMSGPELMKANRKALRSLGCANGQIDAFLERKNLSVSRTVFITDAMTVMANVADINKYITLIKRVTRPEVSLYYQQQIAMAATYHETSGGRLKRLREIGSQAAFDEGTAATHVFAPVDTILWTPAAEAKAQQLLQGAGKGRTVHVWISGKGTEKARQALRSLGIVLHEEAFATPTK